MSTGSGQPGASSPSPTGDSRSSGFSTGVQATASRARSQNTPCRIHFSPGGVCRFGDSCHFSHSAQPAASDATHVFTGGPARGSRTSPQAMATVPAHMPSMPPVHINIPPGQPVYSIDIECVATSVQHNGRSVASIGLVNEWGQPVLNIVVKQEQPVLSYITPLTGLTKEIINANGMPLADAVAIVRRHLPPSAILVGMNILKDVQWLQLNEGVDFASMIDLNALLRVWNPERGAYTNFSQDHCAKVWLGLPDRPNHSAVDDAMISMHLFNAYRTVQYDPMRLGQLQYATLMAERKPGFSSLYPTIDGCCMGNRKKCSCGASHF
jgi:hypothetical protein